MVWRKVVNKSQKTKLRPNWEGPYCLVRIVGEGAYELEGKNDNILRKTFGMPKTRGKPTFEDED